MLEKAETSNILRKMDYTVFLLHVHFYKENRKPTLATASLSPCLKKEKTSEINLLNLVIFSYLNSYLQGVFMVNTRQVSAFPCSLLIYF